MTSSEHTPAPRRWPSERRECRDPVTGARPWQLTAHPAHHFPLLAADSSLTPGGDLLLFTSDRAGGPHLDLFCLEMATGEIIQVTDTDRLLPHQVTPAADGMRAIANLGGEDGEVVAIDLETGEWETLAVFLRSRLDGCHRSASGEYVVTVVTTAEGGTITAVHTEGMRTIPVLEAETGVELGILDWGLGIGDKVDPQSKIRSPFSSPRFSPDSKNSIVYVAAAPEAIHCVEFDGTGDRVLYAAGASGEAPGEFSAPTWMGSGEEVLFVAGRAEGPVVAVPREGGSSRVVSAGPYAWARSNPAGDRLVAVARRMSGEVPPPLRGGGNTLSQLPRALPGANLRRPSGAGLRAETGRTDNTGTGDGAPLIVLLDAQSGDGKPLGSARAADARPCFSPDGRSVIYADRDEHGFSQLFLASVAEG